MCVLSFDAPISRAFREAGRECVDASADGRRQRARRSAPARVSDSPGVGRLQIVTESITKPPRVRAQRPRVNDRGEREFHERAFFAGIRRRARAAATCPASRSASRAATSRPWLVMP